MTWHVYGNFLVFSEKNQLFKTDKLWIVMLYVLVWGYIQMLFYSCTMCGICLLFFAITKGGFYDKEAMNNYEEEIAERR